MNTYKQLSLFEPMQSIISEERPNSRKKLPPVELPAHCGKRPRIMVRKGMDMFGYSYSAYCPVCGYSTSPYATMACAAGSWRIITKEGNQ